MFSTLTRQPIARAELNHQNRSITGRRRWVQWIGRTITASVYGLAVIMVVSEIVAFFRIQTNGAIDPMTTGIDEWIRALIMLPIVVALTMHFRRMFQTLSLSANSIARERQTNNWDMLVLTGVDARKIVLGKWWATVRHQWRPYVALGILRALLVVWYGANTSRYYSYYSYGSAPNTPTLINSLAHFMLAGIAVFVLTLANLLFTAACGVSAFNKRSAVALARAIATRLLLIIAIGLIGLVGFRFLISPYYTMILSEVSILSLITLVDNGLTLGWQLSNNPRLYVYSSFYGPGIDPIFAVYLPALILSLVVYGLLTIVLLRFAQWQAVRQNALPPLPANRRNPAKMM